MSTDTTIHPSSIADEPLQDDSAPASIKDSAAYAKHNVTEDLHPAFGGTGIRYDTNSDCFAAETEDTYDEAALFDRQRAFVEALEQFQQGVKPKYKSQIDLQKTHDWNEVMQYAAEARNEYTGVGKKGIMKKIDHRLKTFQTAAPAIQAWLKLLPSTTWYGSIICGGLTIILEAAVNLRKLRKETLNALDQMPLSIEKAEFFMRTYGYPQVNQQVGKLYLAIIEALQHILGWYKRAAGMKYLSAFCSGPAYAETLKIKMKNVEAASEAMTERASQREHLRLKEIRNVTIKTNDQVGELKILAIEARNHLYNVLKDTEVWQEAMQSWKESRLAKENRRASRDQTSADKEEEQNRLSRKALLARFGADQADYSRDVEISLGHISSMTLGDQDRVGAIIQHQDVQDWLLNPVFGALLVHGNGKRQDPISPTSVASALLIHVFSKKLRLPTLYWFCGLHVAGPRGNSLGMLQSLVCQLLCLSCCRCSAAEQYDLDLQDLKQLMELFKRLLRRSTDESPVVCILDGLSFYEKHHQVDSINQVIGELAVLANANPPMLILLLTSPIRTSEISREPKITKNLTIAELPDYISGAKQGLDSRQMMSSTENRARRGSETLTPRKGTETFVRSRKTM